jgi:hypothetical protein
MFQNYNNHTYPAAALHLSTLDQNCFIFAGGNYLFDLFSISLGVVYIY